MDLYRRVLEEFYKLDVGQCGVIQASEFESVLHDMEISTTSSAADNIMTRVDILDDGSVHYGEFQRYVQSGGGREGVGLSGGVGRDDVGLGGIQHDPSSQLPPGPPSTRYSERELRAAASQIESELTRTKIRERVKENLTRIRELFNQYDRGMKSSTGLMRELNGFGIVETPDLSRVLQRHDQGGSLPFADFVHVLMDAPSSYPTEAAGLPHAGNAKKKRESRIRTDIRSRQASDVVTWSTPPREWTDGAGDAKLTRFERGLYASPVKTSSDVDGSPSSPKEKKRAEIMDLLVAFSQGKISPPVLRDRLQAHGIQNTVQLDVLIRRSQADGTPHIRDFMREIERQMYKDDESSREFYLSPSKNGVRSPMSSDVPDEKEEDVRSESGHESLRKMISSTPGLLEWDKGEYASPRGIRTGHRDRASDYTRYGWTEEIPESKPHPTRPSSQRGRSSIVGWTGSDAQGDKVRMHKKVFHSPSNEPPPFGVDD